LPADDGLTRLHQEGRSLPHLVWKPVWRNDLFDGPPQVRALADTTIAALEAGMAAVKPGAAHRESLKQAPPATWPGSASRAPSGAPGCCIRDPLREHRLGIAGLGVTLEAPAS
jgi:hypothetical protein